MRSSKVALLGAEAQGVVGKEGTMKSKVLAVGSWLVIGVILTYGCRLAEPGNNRQSQAVEECKRLVLENEVVGNTVRLWYRSITGKIDFFDMEVHAINDPKDWKVIVKDEPVSQADRLNGIEWKAQIHIVHTLKFLWQLVEGDKLAWQDVRSFCNAKEVNGEIVVTYDSVQVEE